MVYDAQPTPEEVIRILRIDIAKETGWSLEYIDQLSIEDVGDYIGVTVGRQKAEDKLNKTKMNHRKGS